MAFDWKAEAERLKFDENKSWTETAKAVAHYFPDLNGQQVFEKVRGALRKSDKYKSDKPETANLSELLKEGVTTKQAADELGVSERTASSMIQDLIDGGLYIIETGGVWQISNIPELGRSNLIKRDWNGDKIIRFALAGDNQSGSKYTQITHMHHFYDIVEYEGITDVYHPGDITEGDDMRTGHKYECYVQGGDDHVDEVAKNYPKRKGVKTTFVTGNHDHSIIKHAGINIGPKITAQRPDLEYIGLSSAVIELTPNCKLELSHPEDGTAYAISYKTQKRIEAMFGGEKPNILAVGHYHKAEYIFYRNIHCIQTGCFQAQTPWMKGKQIAAMMGGWIVEAHVNDDGSIRRFKPEFIPYYKAIKDDYKNWQ